MIPFCHPTDATSAGRTGRPTLDLAGLGLAVQEFYRMALTPSTRRSYESAQKRFLHSFVGMQISPQPLSQRRCFVAMYSVSFRKICKGGQKDNYLKFGGAKELFVAVALQGGLGHAPPEQFLIFRPSEITSGAFFRPFVISNDMMR